MATVSTSSSVEDATTSLRPLAAAEVASVAKDVVTAASALSLFSAFLDLPQVRCGNRTEVERKLTSMLEGGVDQLLVIADFDHTLSKAFENGQRCRTSHGIFDFESEKKNPDFAKKLREMTTKYLAIEYDPHLSVEEKTPYMVEWWTTSHTMILNEGFTRQVIEDFVLDAATKESFTLRDGAVKWIRDLEAVDAPLVVFSAGIGNIIETLFRLKFGPLPSNLHVISNMMIFDDQGILKAFSEPLIHVFCKNSTVISPDASFYEHLNRRHNVLLMGDSLGDLHMDVGVKEEHTVIKIGFLNTRVDELLPKYLEGYDIVVLEDQSMQVPQAIFDMIRRSRL